MAQYTEEQIKAVNETLLDLKYKGEKAKIELSLLYKKDKSLRIYGKIEGIELLASYIDKKLKKLQND